MAGRRIGKGKPVRVESPHGQNVHYKNQVGTVKDSELLIGGVWSHLVQLNSGARVWFTSSELKVLKST